MRNWSILERNTGKVIIMKLEIMLLTFWVGALLKVVGGDCEFWGRFYFLFEI